MTDAERDAAYLGWLHDTGRPLFRSIASQKVDAWNAAWAVRQKEIERLRRPLEKIFAAATEVDGRCGECALKGCHEDWCSVGIAQEALGEQ